MLMLISIVFSPHYQLCTSLEQRWNQLLVASSTIPRDRRTMIYPKSLGHTAWSSCSFIFHRLWFVLVYDAKVVCPQFVLLYVGVVWRSSGSWRRIPFCDSSQSLRKTLQTSSMKICTFLSHRRRRCDIWREKMHLIFEGKNFFFVQRAVVIIIRHS